MPSPTPSQFKRLGSGTCGVVFARDTDCFIVKVARRDDDALKHDYDMHKIIRASFEKYPMDSFCVSQCYGFCPKNGGVPVFQNESSCHVPADTLVSGRIPRLAGVTRRRLIETFCRPDLDQAALRDPANKDCLVRLYLGSTQGRMTRFFSLRNFKMHLNQLVSDTETSLDDLDRMASIMGQVLAVMHWEAKTDARGIEIVMGATNGADMSTSALIYPCLYILDFDRVQTIPMDADGVQMAEHAFWENDPYYPRPLGSRRQRNKCGKALSRVILICLMTSWRALRAKCVRYQDYSWRVLLERQRAYKD